MEGTSISLNRIFVEGYTCGETKRNMRTEWDEREVGILNIDGLLFEFLLSLSDGFSLLLAEV